MRACSARFVAVYVAGDRRRRAAPRRRRARGRRRSRFVGGARSCFAFSGPYLLVPAAIAAAVLAASQKRVLNSSTATIAVRRPQQQDGEDQDRAR